MREKRVWGRQSQPEKTSEVDILRQKYRVWVWLRERMGTSEGQKADRGRQSVISECFPLWYPCQRKMTSVHWAALRNKHDVIRKLLALRGDLSLQDLVSKWHVVTACVVLFSDVVFSPAYLRFWIDQLVNSLNSCACRRATVHLLVLYMARATPTWFSCWPPNTPQRSICLIRYIFRVVRG